MKTNKQYKSDAFAAIHESADALHQIGAINKQTMRQFDKACISEAIEIPASAIKELRERENVSQPVFATYLNVSKNLVSDWERGIKKPGGPALRLLNIVNAKGLNALA